MTGLTSPDHIRDQCEELAVLLPALPAALERDTGVSTGEHVTTTDNVHTVPINVDVADALRHLAGLTPGHLHQLAGDYAQAHDNDRTADAHQLATQIRSWLATARRALGLNHPDQPTGQICPQHDDPATELVVPGDHGELLYDHLDHGRPVHPWVRWRHHDVVTCRHCCTTWTPAQYRWLGRLIRHANNRRTQLAPQNDDAP